LRLNCVLNESIPCDQRNWCLSSLKLTTHQRTQGKKKEGSFDPSSENLAGFI
jgi:hypothetical protein